VLQTLKQWNQLFYPPNVTYMSSGINPATCFGFQQAPIRLCTESETTELHRCSWQSLRVVISVLLQMSITSSTGGIQKYYKLQVLAVYTQHTHKKDVWGSCCTYRIILIYFDFNTSVKHTTPYAFIIPTFKLTTCFDTIVSSSGQYLWTTLFSTIIKDIKLNHT
jgi:hypothetical protein